MQNKSLASAPGEWSSVCPRESLATAGEGQHSLLKLFSLMRVRSFFSPSLNRLSCSPGWSQTHYVAEDVNGSSLLSSLMGAGIAGMSQHT